MNNVLIAKFVRGATKDKSIQEYMAEGLRSKELLLRPAAVPRWPLRHSVPSPQLDFDFICSNINLIRHVSILLMRYVDMSLPDVEALLSLPNLIQICMWKCPGMPNTTVIREGIQHFHITHTDLCMDDVGVWPDSLETLRLHYNSNMAHLGVLPSGLQFLSVRGKDIKSLPELPNRLNTLHIRHTSIQELPHLPESLLDLAADIPLDLPAEWRLLDVAASRYDGVSIYKKRSNDE